jgi:predicted nucleotidyltransferase
MFSTGNKHVDQILLDSIRELEDSFPGDIRAYYLTGSYANGNPLPTSDVDFHVVFKSHSGSSNDDKGIPFGMRIFEDNRPVSEQFEKFQCVSRRIRGRYDVQLELVYKTEDDLRKWPVGILLDGTLVYGDGIRQDLQLPDIRDYICRTMHIGFSFIQKARNDLARISSPLGFPDPNDEFLGYVSRISSRPVKPLGPMMSLGFLATGLIAAKGRTYVGKKHAIPSLYKTHVNDRWTAFVHSLHTHCRELWHYRVPTEVRERNALKRMCVEALDFENHFFSQYKSMVLGWLKGEDHGRASLSALALEKFRIADSQIEQAMESYSRNGA